jgi:hypothetical protein
LQGGLKLATADSFFCSEATGSVRRYLADTSTVLGRKDVQSNTFITQLNSVLYLDKKYLQDKK